jgi:hypothetical protein
MRNKNHPNHTSLQQTLKCILCFMIFLSCNEKKKLLFEKMPGSVTGLEFLNELSEDHDRNVLTYEYFYNGTGVATGDVNNDGLADVFLTGNQVPSKLFLNEGGWKFRDVTSFSGVGGREAWKTGVTMADVNGDGRLDIYVCHSGFGTVEQRSNELFINAGIDENGDVKFREEAKAYGLDAPGTYTSQVAFFDYDRDGDLDMFMLNHANTFYSPFFNTRRLRGLRHPQFGNRLYRNDQNHFIDVSAEAGIDGSGINFGLGLAISDLNNDGWPDIFVSNDFEEQDFLYLNNRKGGFDEECKNVFAHISKSTMGVDIADYNNDGLFDVFTLDMLPEDNYRQKVLKGPDQYDKFSLMVDSGFGYQYSRNMLQLNRGFGRDSLPVFSEIGELSGISKTDWSWSVLCTDFDNDGWKDLFITNGYLRDYTDLDFLNFDVAEAIMKAKNEGKDISTKEKYQQNLPLYELVKKMPSTKISNYLYRNNKDLTFANQTNEWGLSEPGISSGAAYADLDNDGDLDLIVCNNGQPVWLYQNHTSEYLHNNYLAVKLAGTGMNRFAIGAKVFVSTNEGTQLIEQYPVRGYQSSVDYKMIFGLGNEDVVKELKVIWPDGKISRFENLKCNQVFSVDNANSIQDCTKPLRQTASLFRDVSLLTGIDFVQSENPFVDFKNQFLIPYQLSRQGPKMAKADVNADGYEDFFIGAPSGQSGVLYLQKADGKFERSPSQPWQNESACEDIGSLFFDADQDGDMDLYIVSGGNEWPAGSPQYQDRLYLNNGNGKFEKASESLPTESFSGSCVTACDYDHDGDLDLFIGTRLVPGNFPLSQSSQLLRNDSKKNIVKFSNITREAAPALVQGAMVTDASWTDIDNDGWEDLIVVGDWSGVKVYQNQRGRLHDVSKQTGLENSGGFWSRIIPADVDQDGFVDFVVGNLGMNHSFGLRNQSPLNLYVSDFNDDGKVDPIITWHIDGKEFPINSKDEVGEQLPGLKKKFLRYADYANATITDVFSPVQIQGARKLTINNTQTSLLINNKGKFFSFKPLPHETQFSPVSCIIYNDFDGDGKKDLLLTGNFFPFRVQHGRADASLGSLLKGDNKGNFTLISRKETGLLAEGDIRDMIFLQDKKRGHIIIAKNNSAVQILKTAY